MLHYLDHGLTWLELHYAVTAPVLILLLAGCLSSGHLLYEMQGGIRDRLDRRWQRRRADIAPTRPEEARRILRETYRFVPTSPFLRGRIEAIWASESTPGRVNIVVSAWRPRLAIEQRTRRIWCTPWEIAYPVVRLPLRYHWPAQSVFDPVIVGLDMRHGTILCELTAIIVANGGYSRLVVKDLEALAVTPPLPPPLPLPATGPSEATLHYRAHPDPRL